MNYSDDQLPTHYLCCWRQYAASRLCIVTNYLMNYFNDTVRWKDGRESPQLFRESFRFHFQRQFLYVLYSVDRF